MLIHFIHPGRAYLPELTAYSEFLHKLGHSALIHDNSASVPTDAAVCWWICGRVPIKSHRRLGNAFHIHEYASASVPPLTCLKDQLKILLQPTPHYRIYQNSWVRDQLKFTDNVPFEFRDMGVAESFLSIGKDSAPPDFDGVYLGDMQRLRGFASLFHTLRKSGQRTLFIGTVHGALQKILQPFGQVTGPVPHHLVPSFLRRARYGLNLVPAHPPYSEQTSTKLLEYCAVGLPVVSTDYHWVRAFEKRHGARFAYLPDADVTDCIVPDVSMLAWPRILERLSVWRNLGLQP